MNKVYRSVWNASLGTWIAAPETAKTGRTLGRQALLAVAGALLISAASENALAACATSNTCTGNEIYTTGTDGALSGNWSFTDNSALGVGTAAGTGTGTLTFTDNSVLDANLSGAVDGSTIFLSGNSRMKANASGAVDNSNITLSGSSTLEVRTNNGLNNSNITLQGNSILTGGANTLGTGNSLVFDGGGTFAMADANHEVNVISSAAAGDGNITSIASDPRYTGVATLTLRGDGTQNTHSFSGKLGDNTLTGTHSLHLDFQAGNWEFTGHNSNAAQLELRSGVTLTSHGYQDVVTAYTGSVLKGDGRFKQVSINRGATISPDLNTMEIQYFLLYGGSIYEITANDTGSASRIDATNLTIDRDAEFHVNALSGNWSTTQTYEILTGNNIATGGNNVRTIDSSKVSSNFAYLTPTITTAMTGNSGVFTLTLTPNNVPGNSGLLASQAHTPNQVGVANAVESLPTTHELYNHVLTLPAGSPAATFDNLSGEAHASLTHTALMLTEHGSRLSLANLRNSLNAGFNPAAASAQVGGTMGSTGLPAFGDKPAWVSLIGNWQKVDGDSNNAQLDQNSTGVFVGYDNEISNGWYLGGALGYTQTNADVSKRHSDADIDSYSATLYGGKAFALDTQRQLNVSAGLSYSYHDIDTTRRIFGLDQKLKADYDTHSTQLFAEVGYLIGQPDGQNIEPFAGLSVTHLSSDSFKEKGGSAALRSSSASETQTVSSLGVRGQTPYEFGNFGASVYGSVAWQHAFNRTQFDRTMAFADGGQAFSVEGVALDRDTAVVGLGTQVNLTPRAALSLDYQGRFASGLTDHSASLKAQWSF